jgi:pyruvate/2-oxoglutarate dehydrogenase complex dihydrolipoamide acyltransferase (E2) component
VPIFRDVHMNSLSRISRERAGLAMRGAPRRLAPEEPAGCVLPFSYSLIPDSLLFTPITRPPQHASPAAGTIADMPVVRRRSFVDRSLTVTKGGDQW